jgi:hypothetical protein
VVKQVGALREAPSRKRAGLVTGAVREPPLLQPAQRATMLGG